MRIRIRKNVLAVAALAVALSGVALGCGRDDSDDGGESGEAGAPAAAPGFDGESLSLGAIVPTSGPLAGPLDSFLSGINTYVDEVNAEGGLAGEYELELAVQDSKNDPATTVQAYNSSKEDRVIYAGIYGTAPTAAVLPQLDADGVVGLPISFDARWVREQQLVANGTPYPIQAINAVEWTAENRDASSKQLCTLLQEGEAGVAFREGFDFAFDELGVKPALDVEGSPVSTDFTPQVTRLRSAGCEVVYIGAAIPIAVGAMSKAAELGWAPEWVGIEASYSVTLKESPLIGYLEDNFTLVAGPPAFGDTDNASGMARLMESKDRFAPKAPSDWTFMAGYTSGMAMDQILTAAIEDGDLSREGVVEAMNGLDELDYEGLASSYQWGPPDDREPSLAANVFSIDPSTVDGLTTVEFGFEGDIAPEFGL